MIPSVSITKSDGNTGVVRPGPDGVLAIIAASPTGVQNVAVTASSTKIAQDEFGSGPLVELAAYTMAVSKRPTLLVRGTGSVVGTYGTITKTGAGTANFTAGGTAPRDDYDVYVEFVTGGTVGTAGITYRYSLGGANGPMSGIIALGTANSIVIPNSGVTLAIGAGTIAAGTTVTLRTNRPRMNDADLTAALEALRVTSAPWEAVVIDADATAATVSLVDQWIRNLAAAGRFKTSFLTAAPKGTATATQYRDTLAATFAEASSLDVVVAADLADVTSSISGIVQPRPWGALIAARAMATPLGTDLAYVALGPVVGAGIKDARGNPKYHDEDRYPGLDALRLATARSFPTRNGVFPTNVPMLSPVGSDYVYLQHARVINRGAEIAYEVLEGQLSRGVRKNPQPGPGGERYISESDAMLLEQLVNAELSRQLVRPGFVDDMQLLVSRTDDIRSNQGAVINAELQCVSLAYVKKFQVTAKFVTEIG
jgi:hypothetical protein